MAQAVVDIPEERLSDLEPYKEKLGEALLLGISQMRIHEALLLYERGAVSFARAAELAGLHRDDMTRYARAFGAEPHWSEDMLQEELSSWSSQTPAP